MVQFRVPSDGVPSNREPSDADVEDGLGAELERVAVDVATRAARFVRAAVPRLAVARRDGGVAVGSKSTATDLVTDVDRASEALLVEALGRLRPGDAVLGEEGGQHPAGTSADGSVVERSGIQWVVDPIDGTVNFVLGIPYFSVSVAARRGAFVLAGCVVDVLRGEVFSARAGGGSFVRSATGAPRRLVGPRPVDLSEAVVGTGFGYDREVRRRQGAIMAALLTSVGNVRRMGSAALDLCYVAAGRLDAYYEAGLNDWDRAAGLLIVTEAGAAAATLAADGVLPETTLAAGATVLPDLTALVAGLVTDTATA
ncbi:MAG: inositol monophosphatase family protein [bacterium]